MKLYMVHFLCQKSLWTINKVYKNSKDHQHKATWRSHYPSIYKGEAIWSRHRRCFLSMTNLNKYLDFPIKLYILARHVCMSIVSFCKSDDHKSLFWNHHITPRNHAFFYAFKSVLVPTQKDMEHSMSGPARVYQLMQFVHLIVKLQTRPKS